MKSSEVRQTFIDYFKKRNHTPVTSSSLIPHDDPSLLFINAGMAQFKNTFTGVEKRNYTKATSAQKCVRAGGKHNDLDNVGHTARHHTFFEMLGNFSFGDYFKEDAIRYAWDFLTNTLKIPKEKLYVTVFEDDDEAAEIWHNQEGVPKNRIFRFGEADNFWRMGDVGPCGPCSEIFYDHGPQLGQYASVKEGIASGDDRYVEIWNLVFMQFFEDKQGKQTPLPKPSIDTGAGLERLSAVMQKKVSNYDTDIFRTLIEKIETLANISYKNDGEQAIAMRVLADHVRSCAFLIADGVMPSNEGRGYVLRRILRRGVRYGRKLSHQSLMPQLVPTLIKLMGDFYPELKQRQQLIIQVVADEETRFLQTLDQGTSILNQALDKLKQNKEKTLSGSMAFKLYDTYGFPLDLTKIMVQELGMDVDESGFESEMTTARTKAKSSWKGKGASTNEAHLAKFGQEAAALLAPFSKNKEPHFIGYTHEKSEQPILLLSNGTSFVKQLKEGEEGFVFFRQTPFYGEGGGQVGDTGTIKKSQAVSKQESKESIMNVFDCTKYEDTVIHHVHVDKGVFCVDDICQLEFDKQKRKNSMANHSATHLLHSSLRQVLGDHVTQAGSLVTPEKLRFDFTHNHPLAGEEISAVESLVQKEVFKHNLVESDKMSYSQAIDSGALALFGEKYGDDVRVIKMGDFSTELCGGTHVKNTSWIYDFVITSEVGVSSGVRRIEAITGQKAFDYNKNSRRHLEIAKKEGGLPCFSIEYPDDKNNSELSEVIFSYKKTIKSLEKNLESLKLQKIDVDSFIRQGHKFEANNTQGLLVTVDLEISDRKILTDVCDKIKSKIKTGIVVVIGKGPLIVSVTQEFCDIYPARDLLKEMVSVMDGKGGGRKDFAQGAVPNKNRIKEALSVIVNTVIVNSVSK